MTYRVFLDIETTGLERSDLILEVGMVICSLSDGQYQSLHSNNWLYRFPVESRQMMNIPDVVMEMHQSNNLWGECATSPDAWTTYGYMQSAIVEWLDDHLGSEQSPMCGSGVHFDREFLKRLMPGVERRFHYRNIDTSTMRTMYKDATGKDSPFSSSDSDHRALGDCFLAIREANYFAALMRTGAGIAE